jgi:murein DD-endopeptidase MepM/ murein hydrolase activator NlpD
LEKPDETGMWISPENRIWVVVLVLILMWGGLFYDSDAAAFSRTPELQKELMDRDMTDNMDLSEIKIITGVFNGGDTASCVLGPFLPLQIIYRLEKQSRPVFSFSRFKKGQPFQISLVQDAFSSFEYEIDDQYRLEIKKNKDRFDITRVPIQYEIQEHVVSVEIESNISAALKQAGQSVSLAWDLADIFAWDIDFSKDLLPEDRFQVLVEKRFRKGEFQGYGQILAAVFVNKGLEYKAFQYTDTRGHAGYYDENGRSLQKAFLKSPVKFSKITSYFSTNRFHPILKTSRPHPGVDYAAPKNTPIKTVADGTISQMAYNNTMGRYITIRHFNGYETSYYHMNAYAKGMKKGASVGQGDVIGYVGKTGLATGYHVCFRMTKNGSPVNPLKIAQTAAEPVSSDEKQRFAKTIAYYREKLMTADSLAWTTR